MDLALSTNSHTRIRHVYLLDVLPKRTDNSCLVTSAVFLETLIWFHFRIVLHLIKYLLCGYLRNKGSSSVRVRFSVSGARYWRAFNYVEARYC